MATAHSSAPVAEPNEAMNPSPIVFTSAPPCAASAARTMRSCSRSTSRALASPSRWVIAVEPSMSIKGTQMGIHAGLLERFAFLIQQVLRWHVTTRFPNRARNPTGAPHQATDSHDLDLWLLFKRGVPSSQCLDPTRHLAGLDHVLRRFRWERKLFIHMFTVLRS